MESLAEVDTNAHLLHPASNAKVETTGYMPDFEQIQLLHTELAILLGKFLASSDVISCGDLLFEQVQSSHIQKCKKNRKLLRDLAILLKHWVGDHPFHEHHVLAQFQDMWKESYPSYLCVFNEFKNIKNGKTFEDEEAFNGMRSFLKMAATWKDIIIWGHFKDERNPVCACLVKFEPSNEPVKRTVLCNVFVHLQRKGYGSMLLKQVTDFCISTKSVDFIESFVRLDDNQKGVIRFYEKNGFEQVEIDYGRINPGSHADYHDTVRLLFDCNCNASTHTGSE